MSDLTQQIATLFLAQKQDWKLARDNYAALANVQTRYFKEDGKNTVLQFNPERIRSSAAKIDNASLNARPCFFCHRPEEQKSILYNDTFEILLNPYPIFQNHLTIPLRRHEKQQIGPYYKEMLDLASDLSGYAIFYNGPKCGASAPDHMHFQAGNVSAFPLVRNSKEASKALVWQGKHSALSVLSGDCPVVLQFVSTDKGEVASAFEKVYNLMPVKPGEYEPMMNILTWMEGKTWVSCIFPRKELRPSCYYAEGEANILISPATVEMSGLFVVPLEKDFEKVTYVDLKKIWKEVSIAETEKNEIILKIKEKI